MVALSMDKQHNLHAGRGRASARLATRSAEGGTVADRALSAPRLGAAIFTTCVLASCSPGTDAGSATSPPASGLATSPPASGLAASPTASAASSQPYPVVDSAYGTEADFDIAVDGDELRIEYEVRNEGPEAVIVVDQLPELIGPSTPTPDDIDPEKAYVGLVDGDTARISRQAFAEHPDEASGESAPAVAGTRLRPWDSLESSIVLDLPLVAMGPGYRTAEYSAPGLPRATRMDVCQAVIPDFDSDSDDFVVVGVNRVEQQLLCSGAESLREGVTIEELPEP